MERRTGRFRRSLGEAGGQAAVEFALVLPIVLLLVFGIVEFGRIYGDFTVLQSAAREAVRVAATGGDDQAVAARVRDAAPGLDPSQISIEVDRDTGRRLVTVRLEYPVTLLTGWIGEVVGSQVILRTAAVMAYDVGH